MSMYIGRLADIVMYNLGFFSLEKVSTSDTFISPNRFGNLFYDASIKDTEEKTDDYFTNQ